MKNKIRISIIGLIMMTISIINLFKPVHSFSSQENRYLQRLPELNMEDILSGKYTSDFEKYTTDQFPYRDLWIKVKTGTDLLMQKKDNGRVYFGKNNFLFDVNNDFDQEQFHKNIKHVNNFIEKINGLNQDIRIGAILIPSKETVHSNLLPKYAPIINEHKIVEDLKKTLPQDFYLVNLIDTLDEKSNEYIYYRTDHHWTTKGAYYGYTALSDVLGYKPYNEDEFYIEKVSEDFLGTIYRKANLYSGKPDSIYKYSVIEHIKYNININESNEKGSLYDEKYLEKVDKYSYFLGGDYSVVDIETSVNNGKTIVIIKDSFANSILPFLSLHYERIILIDTRYFGDSIPEYIKNKNVDDILFVFNIQNFSQFKSFNLLSR
jgi:hypothetical protein